MVFLGEYVRNYCLDKDCESCMLRFDCLHYVPRTDVEEENFDSDTEYRLSTRNDETSLELRRRITEILARKGIPEKEAWRIVSLWYLQRWKVKDLLEIVDKIHPLEIESIIWTLMKDDILVFLQTKIENEEDGEEREKLIEVCEALKDDEEFWYLPQINDILAEMLASGWTGEVRVESTTDESDCEEEKTNEGVRDFSEIKKLLKSIIFVKSGKTAYQISERVKAMCSNGLREWRKELSKAWEVRKKLAGLPLEEKIAKYKEITGWLF